MSASRRDGEAWRAVHFASIAKRQVTLWLHCRQCQHNAYTEPLAFGAEHGLPDTTPFTDDRETACLHRLRASQCPLLAEPD